MGALWERWPTLRALIHPLEREPLAGIGGAAPSGARPQGRNPKGTGGQADQGALVGTVEAGQTLSFGGLEVRPLHTPGHTAGMLSFLVAPPAGSKPVGAARSGAGPGGFQGGDAVVFTGDTLFRGSVGGVRAPGHTTYTDLRDSIMGTLMELPPETIVYPGHTDSTSVAREWEHNPFIRVWRGLDAEGSERCTALGEPATLILFAEDYDGGRKAWVRWDDGRDDIVPGSRVEPAG